jgi:protein O-mannose beta-1,4-N-acetylglucosaminyltransferase
MVLQFKYSLIHSVLVILAAVLLNLLYYQLLPSLSSSYDAGGRLVSHAVCTGHNHTERRCKFRNVCYKADTKEFVLILDEKSVISGVPSDRFRPALAETSSVNDHNRYFFNYVEVLSQSFQKLRHEYDIQYVTDDTIIFGRFKPDNLMHLLHDDIFPLYATVKQLTATAADDDKRFRIFFFDKWNETFDYPMLQYASSIYRKLIPAASLLTSSQFSGKQLLCFRNAQVGISKETTWYDYGFRQPQGPLPAHGQEVMLRKVVDSVISDLGLADRVCDVRKVILLSRRSNRLILNEPQLMKFISMHSNYRVPVVTLRLEGFTNFTDLVWNIRCAKMLIGIHGSGLVLSAFLPHDAALIELFPFAIHADDYTPYKTLCQLLAIRYSSWMNQHENKSVTHPDFPASLGGINHLPPDMREQITRSVKVKKHICCDDPEWLFRIFQDTFVDVDSFVPVFESVWRDLNRQSERTQRKSHATPGTVTSASCNRIGSQAEISWSLPWNMDMIGLTADDWQDVRYEVVIQSPGRDMREAHVTTVPVLRTKLRDGENLIWIRCIVNSVSGPFSPEPVYC